MAHFDGHTWTDVAPATDLTIGQIYSVSAKDVWAFPTERGDLLHYDGASWSKVPYAGPPLSFIYAARSDDIWAVGDRGAIARWDGKTWKNIGKAPFPSGSSIGAASATDLWLVADHHVYRSRGDAVWTLAAGVPDGKWTTIDVRGARDVTIFGDDSVVKYDGRTWTTIDAHGFYGQIWPDAQGGAWGMSLDGVEHWNGKRWVMVATADGQKDADGVREAWVPIDGGVAHFDGTSWHEDVEDLLKQVRVTAIVGHGGEALAASMYGGILHYDGKSWTSLGPREWFPGPILPLLDGGYLFVGATVMHVEGTRLEPIAPLPNVIAAGAVVVGDTLIVVGTDGQVIRRKLTLTPARAGRLSPSRR
jgi:hypothetical protein